MVEHTVGSLPCDAPANGVSVPYFGDEEMYEALVILVVPSIMTYIFCHLAHQNPNRNVTL